MQVIDPGHVYDLDWLDGQPRSETYPEENADPQNRLTFVKREGPGYPGNVGHHPGTNCQEVLRALIDRVKYLERQVPSWHNARILSNLRRALYWFEVRAAERHDRAISFYPAMGIESEPTCLKCGHIGCEGACHPEEGVKHDV